MKVASEITLLSRLVLLGSQRAGAIASGRGMTKRHISSRSLQMSQEECQRVLVINQCLFVYLTQNMQNTKKLFDQQLLIHPSIGDNLCVVIIQ